MLLGFQNWKTKKTSKEAFYEREVAQNLVLHNKKCTKNRLYIWNWKLSEGGVSNIKQIFAVEVTSKRCNKNISKVFRSETKAGWQMFVFPIISVYKYSLGIITIICNFRRLGHSMQTFAALLKHFVIIGRVLNPSRRLQPLRQGRHYFRKWFVLANCPKN